MKRRIKSILHALGLLGLAQKVYFNTKTVSPSVLRRELRFRRRPPDGYPFPPGRLIFDVIACRWAPVYYDSGKRIVADMEAVLHRSDRSLGQFDSILDFGCGCGRLLRHVHQETDATLYGTDLNPSLIEWCREHLPFGRFSINDLHPPLPFDDDTFDYIYARSVFTHLPEDLQQEWIDELRRLLRPGGCLYLTMHGRRLTGGLSPQQQARFEAGGLVVTYRSLAGENLCSTFAAPAYVNHQLLEDFELVDFVEGRDDEHLRQDIYLSTI